MCAACLLHCNDFDACRHSGMCVLEVCRSDDTHSNGEKLIDMINGIVLISPLFQMDYLMMYEGDWMTLTMK